MVNCLCCGKELIGYMPHTERCTRCSLNRKKDRQEIGDLKHRMKELQNQIWKLRFEKKELKRFKK